MSTCPWASLHLSLHQMKLNALFFCREAISAVCERRGVDVDSINVYLEQSRTPLPLLTTETAWLGGRNIRIRGKSQNLSLAACNQSLVVLPRKAIPGEMRFNLMHCSNSTVGENVSKTQKLINYSVLEKSLTFGYCHAILVAKWTINGLNLFIGQFFA